MASPTTPLSRPSFACVAPTITLALLAGCTAAPVALLDDSAIKVNDRVSLEAIQADLIRYIWGDSGFPAQTLPIRVDAGVPFPVSGLDGICDSVDRYRIQMPHGYSSQAFLLHAAGGADRLLVFHQGHADELDADGGGGAIAFFLAAGYDVLAFYMPDYGPNRGPTSTHDEMMERPRDELGYSPIRYFLEPVAVALNQALVAAPAPYHLIAMMGISGGGWTTTLYAAIDRRVQYSFPVAGSVPLYLRHSANDAGDAEQNYPDLYRIAGYPDLYVMGSAGRHRRQVQILNQYDPCCYAPPDDLSYVTDVNMHLRHLGRPGDFELAVDSGQTEHTISDWTLRNVILTTLNAAVPYRTRPVEDSGSPDRAVAGTPVFSELDPLHGPGAR